MQRPLQWLLGIAIVVCAAQTRGAAVREIPTASSDGAVISNLVDYPGGSRALLIGNSSYQGGWHGLPGVDADLDRMQKALLMHGFPAARIRVERNLTGAQFARALNDFLGATATTTSESKLRTRAVVYVAGHGSVRRDTLSNRPISYFVPVDAPMPDADAAAFYRLAIPVSRLTSDAVQAPDADLLFLLDTCFPGSALQVTPSGFGPRESVSRQLRVRQVIAAGSDAQEVADDGAFTSRLLSGLDGLADLNSDGHITGTELGTYVRLHLAERFAGRQTPVYGNLIISGSGIGQGDVIFRSPAAKSATSQLATAGIGENFRDCPQCPEMVPLSWRVLGLEDAQLFETNERRRGSGLAIGKFEVLFEEWDRCFAEGGCRRWLPDRGVGRGRLPAFGMNRIDAEEFVTWLSKLTEQSYRLLDEEEWQAAAIGGARGSGYGIGSLSIGGANCRNCGSIWDGRPAPAGQFPANEFGLFDLLGNLWELTSTCAPEAPGCGSVVVRGGAFTTARRAVTQSSRGVVTTRHADRNVGFRVARILTN